MRPAGSPAKAQQTGGLRPASEGMKIWIPTVEEFGRWYELQLWSRDIPSRRAVFNRAREKA